MAIHGRRFLSIAAGSPLVGAREEGRVTGEMRISGDAHFSLWITRRIKSWITGANSWIVVEKRG
jgi:hypothetical protein